MITLITGVPGSGKTLSVVSDLAKRVKKDWAGRKIFTHGIPDLTIPTEKIPDGQTIQNMHEWLQWPDNNGSVVIIDEAQNLFPPRGAGSKASPLVEWLHIHRHFGVDLILITQMPSRIDKQVRDLVGAHYHIHKTPLGVRMRYYWDFCQTNPLSGRKLALKEAYKLDKKAFGLYRSAEVHTKVKTPKSRVLIVIPLAIIAFAAFSYWSYGRLKNIGQDDSVVASASAPVISASDVGGAVGNGAKDFAAKAAAPLAKEQSKSLTKEMFQPTVEGRVESKPIYDNIRRVQQFEYPVACISGGNSGCSCYSSQGTAIKEIDKKTCNDYVKNGLPFNPYKDKAAQAQAAPQPVQYQPEPSQVLVMGGQSQQNLMYDGYNEARANMQNGSVVGN